MAILPSNTPTSNAFLTLYAAKNPILISKGGLGSTAQTLQGIVYQKNDFDGLFSIPLNANAPLIAEREGIQFHFDVSTVLATAFPEPSILPSSITFRKRLKAVQEFCLKTRDYNNPAEAETEERFFVINAFLGFLQSDDYFYNTSITKGFDGVMTQSPLTKKTSLNSQEYLSLLVNLSPKPTKISLILSYKTTVKQTVAVIEITENINEYDVYDFDVSPRNLPIQDLGLEYYQLQFVDQDNKPLSAKFMYLLRSQIQQDYTSIVFLNTLSSFETFDFHGFTDHNQEGATETFTNNNYVKKQYYNEITQKIKLRTDPLLRFWKPYLVRELASSQAVFWKVGEKLYPIINITNSIKNDDDLETEETLEIEFEIAKKDIIQ